MLLLLLGERSESLYQPALDGAELPEVVAEYMVACGVLEEGYAVQREESDATQGGANVSAGEPIQ